MIETNPPSTVNELRGPLPDSGPGEQTPRPTGNRGALADWVNEGGSFYRPPRDRDESGDSDLPGPAQPDGKAVGVS